MLDQVNDGQGLDQDSEGSNEGQLTQRLGECLWFIKKRYNPKSSLVIGSIHPLTINRCLWTPLCFDVGFANGSAGHLLQRKSREMET